MSRVRIISNGAPRDAMVTLDGEVIDKVKSVSWHMDASGPAVACIEVWAPTLEVELPAGDVVVIGRRESEPKRPEPDVGRRRWWRRIFEFRVAGYSQGTNPRPGGQR